MHRLGYTHAIARSSALILAAWFTGNASAEVFAPEVFSRAQPHVIPTEPAQSNGLQNARLQPEKDNTELASSRVRLNSHWISLPVKAPQQDQSLSPGLRF
jgi:hypothetical protein